jgi:hypothetical protein
MNVDCVSFQDAGHIWDSQLSHPGSPTCRISPGSVWSLPVSLPTAPTSWGLSKGGSSVCCPSVAQHCDGHSQVSSGNATQSPGPKGIWDPTALHPQWA